MPLARRTGPLARPCCMRRGCSTWTPASCSTGGNPRARRAHHRRRCAGRASGRCEIHRSRRSHAAAGIRRRACASVSASGRRRRADVQRIGAGAHHPRHARCARRSAGRIHCRARHGHRRRRRRRHARCATPSSAAGFPARACASAATRSTSSAGTKTPTATTRSSMHCRTPTVPTTPTSWSR